jgi:hypothetical protein
MGRLNTLHLHDLDALKASRVEPDRTRRVAAIVTAAVVVLLGSALFLMMSDNPPRSVAGEPTAQGAPIAPADANPALTPAEAGAGEAAEATVAVPAGTKLSLEITEAIASADAVVGKEVVAKLATPVMVDGKVAVAAGAKVVGRVTETLELKDKNGNGVFGVAFDRLEIDGKSTPIVAELHGQQLELAPGRLLELELSQEVDLPAETAAPAKAAETG